MRHEHLLPTLEIDGAQQTAGLKSDMILVVEERTHLHLEDMDGHGYMEMLPTHCRCKKQDKDAKSEIENGAQHN